jgi:hypothetical protein
MDCGCAATEEILTFLFVVSIMLVDDLPVYEGGLGEEAQFYVYEKMVCR